MRYLIPVLLALSVGACAFRDDNPERPETDHWYWCVVKERC